MLASLVVLAGVEPVALLTTLDKNTVVGAVLVLGATARGLIPPGELV